MGMLSNEYNRHILQHLNKQARQNMENKLDELDDSTLEYLVENTEYLEILCVQGDDAWMVGHLIEKKEK